MVRVTHRKKNLDCTNSQYQVNNSPHKVSFSSVSIRKESMPLETAARGGAERRPRRRRVLRWIGYLLAGLAGLVVLLAIVGAIYQSVESSNDLRTHSPPGRLIEVNGFKMHLYCVGDGSPTVILESGLGDNWLSWYRVQPALAIK